MGELKELVSFYKRLYPCSIGTEKSYVYQIGKDFLIENKNNWCESDIKILEGEIDEYLSSNGFEPLLSYWGRANKYIVESGLQATLELINRLNKTPKP